MADGGKKLSIVCFSGDFDRAIAVFTLASGAAAVGYRVNLFFTFWGLDIVKAKTGRSFTGRGLLARSFGFLMGGRLNLPLSRFNFLGLSPRLLTGLMRKRNVATLDELIDASRALKVNFYACEMAMQIMGLTRTDLVPDVQEILGVAKFLELADGGQVLFI
ncbi:MAG: DsrE/DsrF/DrsH-like family protein [Candidatus Coatesbacteria bacterium]